MWVCMFIIMHFLRWRYTNIRKNYIPFSHRVILINKIKFQEENYLTKKSSLYMYAVHLAVPCLKKTDNRVACYIVPSVVWFLRIWNVNFFKQMEFSFYQNTSQYYHTTLQVKYLESYINLYPPPPPPPQHTQQFLITHS